MKRLLLISSIIVIILLAVVTGGSLYMINYSLAPDDNRKDTAACFRKLITNYPEMKSWLDSMRNCNGLCDTFVMMPRGECHHAYLIPQADSAGVAIIIHGWRDSAIKFMYLARLYQQMGYNVLMPELHAHGLSEGDAVEMGWNERKDIIHWMTIASQRFHSDDFIVHGVSMGAATTMNVSGESMPNCVKTVKFVEDCGYTSAWDEFCDQMKYRFGLPAFPLLYAMNATSILRGNFDIRKNMPIDAVKRSVTPTVFLHGTADNFVPFSMMDRLYDACAAQKAKQPIEGADHAQAVYTDPLLYWKTVDGFLKGKI